MASKTHIDLSSISEVDRKLLDSYLTKVLKSVHFKSAQKMQRFLRYVIDVTLLGREKHLKQYTIAVEALDYPESFDSDTNPLVRILGVRERLDKYYLDEGKDDAIIISIPKGSYVPSVKKFTVTVKSNKGGRSLKALN